MNSLRLTLNFVVKIQRLEEGKKSNILAIKKVGMHPVSMPEDTGMQWFKKPRIVLESQKMTGLESGQCFKLVQSATGGGG